MFFLVYIIVGLILSLRLEICYLIFFQAEGGSVMLFVLVEEWKNRMMFEGGWAKRNLNIARNIGKILNRFHDKMMFFTVF
jgi:hypothetical protein